jgi:hypothetical protein
LQKFFFARKLTGMNGMTGIYCSQYVRKAENSETVRRRRGRRRRFVAPRPDTTLTHLVKIAYILAVWYGWGLCGLVFFGVWRVFGGLGAKSEQRRVPLIVIYIC